MSTVLELSPSERQTYIEVLRRRAAELNSPLEPEAQQIRDQLVERVREVAAAIKSRFNVQRVILFGSLAHMAWFRPGSDIDLAVQGLEGNAYWEAWRLAEDMLEGREVDFIDIDTASPSLRQAIDKHGIAL